MKSEAEAAEIVVQTPREVLLPEKGAEFEIEYFNDQGPVKYGEGHNWVNAASVGLKVICMGPEFRVSMARQRKPMIPDFLAGEDGCYRRALRIAINGDELGNGADYYVHILGDLVFVGTERLNVAQMVQDQSLTDKDQRTMDRLRALKAGKANGGGA